MFLLELSSKARVVWVAAGGVVARVHVLRVQMYVTVVTRGVCVCCRGSTEMRTLLFVVV